jgi:hypothetical protein
MTCATAVLLLAATTPARASTPDLSTIERIERAVQLPPTSDPIDGYDRFYAPDTVFGRRMIVGLYLATHITDEGERYRKGDPDFWKGGPPRKGRTHLFANKDLLPDGIADGGCEEIHVFWDLARAKVVSIFCNGTA